MEQNSGLSLVKSLNIIVTVIQVTNLLKAHKVKPRPCFVTLIVGGSKHSTESIPPKESIGSWDQSFTISFTKASRLRFEVYCDHGIEKENHIIGETMEIDVFKSKLQPVSDTEVPLIRRGSSTSAGVLTCRIELAKPSKAAAPKAGTSWRATLKGSGISAQFKNNDIPLHWACIVSSLGSLVQLTKASNELNTAVKITLGAVTAILQLIVDQVIRDEKVDSLVEIIATVYRALPDANPDKLAAFERTLKRLVQETTECAYFLHQWKKAGSSLLQAVDGVVSGIDTIIRAFEARFTELRIEFLMGSSLQATHTTLLVFEKAPNNDALDHLQALPLIPESTWSRDLICAQGTREQVLAEITYWAQSTDSRKLYTLIGDACCGKTTIAHTISSIFADQERLGSSVFFSYDQGRNSCKHLFTTLAQGIAALHPSLAEAIGNSVARFPTLATADLTRQLQDLVIKPLRDLTLVGPILVVIDGLDRCDDRATFLGVLALHLRELPSNIRLFITSRPSPDVLGVITKFEHCVRRRLCYDGPDSLEDKAKSVVKGFGERYPQSLPPTRLTPIYDGISDVVRRDTCSGFDILHGLSKSHSQVIVDSLVRCSWSLNPGDELRASIGCLFHTTYRKIPEELRDRFRAFLSFTVTLSQKASIPLHEIFKSEDLADTKMATTVMNTLREIYDGRNTSAQMPFEEFISVQQWHDHAATSTPYAAKYCIKALNLRLKLNLLQIEDRTIPNKDIPDLNVRLKRTTSQVLRHFVLHWVEYLDTPDQGVLKEITEFLKTHLSDWLEILSLMGAVRAGFAQLELLADWLRTSDAPSWMYNLVYDTIRFIQLCGQPLSTYGLLTSRLLLVVPGSSLLHQIYAPDNLADLITFSRPSESWPPYDCLVEHSTSTSPKLATFSGRSLLVSSCGDQLIVWDAKSGQLVKQATSDKSSDGRIAMSPSGKQVVWCHTPFERWDISTTAPSRIETFDVGISRAVHCAAYSPDGSTLAISTQDIFLWDFSENECSLLRGSQNNAAIWAISFSPDGLHLASTHGTQARVVDMSGHIVHRLQHNSGLENVVWSSNGKYIATWSWTSENIHTCHLWDAHSGKEIRAQPHLFLDKFIAFTPDGIHVILPREVQDPARGNWMLFGIEDVVTGQQIRALSYNGRLHLTSLAVIDAPGCQRLAVGSYGGQVLSWDLNPMQLPDPKKYNIPKRRGSQTESGTTSPKSYDYADSVNEEGWFCTKEGRRLIWLPWPYRGAVEMKEDGVTIHPLTGVIQNVDSKDNITLNRKLIDLL
ncbi:hypothetical protein BDN72DRAFT_900140 [Pluteus cervinus]|uniref:Uncharacterized protein n=1 Tax=Pluteus cervinus TaxID=181527 RepID=A0ACD3AL54_9AGAR|nr:hypothetical protein BDN72DRAFT_900140 [Pluteus cervinus]